MEYALQQQGFDYCYDKRLYDRLAHEDAASVRGHLQADIGLPGQAAALHREPRRAAGGPTFGPRARAAAVVMATVPGGKLYHDGQFDGLRTHVPVFLARGPVEERDPRLRLFYSRLVGLEVSDWRLLEVVDHDDLVAWSFSDHLVVVNLGPADAWGRVQVAVDGDYTDLLTGASTSAQARNCRSACGPGALTSSPSPRRSPGRCGAWSRSPAGSCRA